MKKTKLIVFLVVSMLIVTSAKITWQVYANKENIPAEKATDLPSLETTVYFTQNSKTYKQSILDHVAEEIAPVAGVISPDKKLIAYTVKKENSWGIEPYIFLYNIKNKSTQKIQIEDSSIPRFVHSWSTDGSKLLLLTNAQSVGEIEGTIYDLKAEKVISKINLYSYTLAWLDDETVIYVESIKDCSKKIDCITSGTEVTKQNTTSGKKEKLTKLEKNGSSFPIINDFILSENKVNILLSTMHQVASEEINVKYEEKKVNVEIDLVDKKIKELSYEDNFKEKLKAKLPYEFKNLRVANFIKDEKHEGYYLLELNDSFQDGMRKVIYINLDGGSEYKLISDGSSITL